MAYPETASGPGDLKGFSSDRSLKTPFEQKIISFMGGDEDAEVSGIETWEFTCNYVGAKVSEYIVFKSASDYIPLSLFQTH